MFNTSNTLKPGIISVGIEPSIFTTSDIDFNLFLHGGVGLTNRVDLALKFAVMGDQVYLGGDVEFATSDHFSVTAGAHSYGVFGLDALGLYTFSLGRNSSFYSGVDVDMNFHEDKIRFPVWIPMGIEIPIRKHINFYFETGINVTSSGNHFIGGGLSFLI